MRIAVASDHAGLACKERIAEMLRDRGHEVVDLHALARAGAPAGRRARDARGRARARGGDAREPRERRAGGAGRGRPGTRRESLARLAAEARDPFDLVFLGADKPGYPDYLAWALRLSRPGSLVVADNVVRDGAVADADSRDPAVQGVRRFPELLAAEPRLTATALQTVGRKGHDGLAIALVTDGAKGG